MRRFVLGLVFVVFLPAWASAQAFVFNPRTLEFVASADHNVILADGATPKLTRYELRFFAPSAPLPISTHDLGKPTPGAGGLVTMPLTDHLVGVPFDPQVRYVARVVAIGPGGEGVSDDSNPFGFATAPVAPTRPLVKP